MRRNVQIHNMDSSHVLTTTDTHARIDAAREKILAFGVQRLELVTTESLSPFIGPHILAEAKTVILADLAILPTVEW